MKCPRCQAEMIGSPAAGWSCSSCGMMIPPAGNIASELNIQISDVNASLWSYIWKRRWWEVVAFGIVSVAYEIGAIWLLGPVAFHSQDSRGPADLLAFVALVPLLIGFGWYQSLKNRFEMAFLQEFATANDYDFDAKGTVDETYGTAFRVGTTRRVSDVVTGSYQGHDMRLFLYEVTVQAGRSTITYKATVMELDTGGALPEMLLASVKAMGVSQLVASDFRIRNRLTLEGDFSRNFSLFAPVGTEIEALQVFAPDFMALVEDHTAGRSIEFAGDRVYLYTDRFITVATDLAQTFAAAKLLLTKLAPVAGRLSHDSVVTPPPANLNISRALRPKRIHQLALVSGITIAIIAFTTALLGHFVKPGTVVTNPDTAFQTAVKAATAAEASGTSNANPGAALLVAGNQMLAASVNDNERAEAHYWLADGYFWQGDNATALAQSNEAIGLNTADTDSMAAAGRALVNLRRPAEAVAMANRALAIKPQAAAALSVRAFAEYDLGQKAAALVDMNRVAAIDEAAGETTLYQGDLASRDAMNNPRINFLYFKP